METPILSKKEFNKIKTFLPAPRGRERCNDLLVISGIIFIISNCIPWRHLPEIYGNWNTVYSRFNRWSKNGVWALIFDKLRSKLKKRNVVMIDSTTVKVHRTSASMRYDKLPRKIGRSRGGLTSKIHLLCTEDKKPIDFILTEGQASDIGVAPELVIRNTKYIKVLLGDRGYDSSNFRKLLIQNKIEPVIPPRSNRREKIEFDKEIYKKRGRIENMFVPLKDWRGIAMRYCRCAHTFHSFICIALFTLFF